MKCITHNLEHLLKHFLTEGLMFTSCTFEGWYFISTMCTFQKKGNLLDCVFYLFILHYGYMYLRCTKIKVFQGALGVFWFVSPLISYCRDRSVTISLLNWVVLCFILICRLFSCFHKWCALVSVKVRWLFNNTACFCLFVWGSVYTA